MATWSDLSMLPSWLLCRRCERWMRNLSAGAEEANAHFQRSVCTSSVSTCAILIRAECAIGTVPAELLQAHSSKL